MFQKKYSICPLPPFWDTWHTVQSKLVAFKSQTFYAPFFLTPAKSFTIQIIPHSINKCGHSFSHRAIFLVYLFLLCCMFEMAQFLVESKRAVRRERRTTYNGRGKCKTSIFFKHKVSTYLSEIICVISVLYLHQQSLQAIIKMTPSFLILCIWN